MRLLVATLFLAFSVFVGAGSTFLETSNKAASDLPSLRRIAWESSLARDETENVTSIPKPTNPKLVDVFPAAAKSGCMACHADLELIRQVDSEMMQQIIARGTEQGDPAGCTVCHGGDPRAETKEAAHGGDFYLDPGSPWVNNETCGQCHPAQVESQWRSLMMTEAGKIQGVCWAFGGLTGYEHRFANYAVENPTDPKRRFGSEAYRDYMQRLAENEPNVFVDHHDALPEALKINELDQLNDHPELAA